MILSVPMTSLVKIALESYEKTQGLAFMLGSDTEIELIEGLETADAIKREKKKDYEHRIPRWFHMFRSESDLDEIDPFLGSIDL